MLRGLTSASSEQEQVGVTRELVRACHDRKGDDEQDEGWRWRRAGCRVASRQPAVTSHRTVSLER